MSIFIRQSNLSDSDGLFDLAKQFTLLNLPADKNVLNEILELSENSFKGNIDEKEREYLFVAEDAETNKVIGASKICARHGSEDNPHLYYKITKKEKFSSDLGIGFIHQVLNFKEDFDGPTELGGLIVDKSYRKRPEKVGKSISLVRFMYIALNSEIFSKNLHCELAPPLTSEGRSEFWEALGRRFTGMPYEEADRLCQKNKGFIKSLFPGDEIYMTLLESSARLVVGEVSNETKPARALLEQIGFKYKDEIDPFDGGPHYGALQDDVLPIKYFAKYKLKFGKKLDQLVKPLLVGGFVDGCFKAKVCTPQVDGNNLILNSNIISNLNFSEGQEVYTVPLYY